MKLCGGSKPSNFMTFSHTHGIRGCRARSRREELKPPSNLMPQATPEPASRLARPAPQDLPLGKEQTQKAVIAAG